MDRMVQIRLSLPTTPPASDRHAAFRPSLRNRLSRRPPITLLIAAFTFVFVLSITLLRSHTPTQDLYAAAKDDLGRAEWADWGDFSDIADRFETGVEKGKEMLELSASSCVGWGPEQPEDNDPAGCVRAKQYRQVQRVLKREELGAHGHWWFTQKKNVATLKQLARCFLPTDDEGYTPCPDRPLIINGYWWSALTLMNGTSGESIWQESVLKQIETYNVMTLYVGDYSNWIVVAQMMPDVYRFVWAPEVEIISCFTDPRCVAAEHYTPPQDGEDLSVGVPDEERGVIPIWRLQIVDYPKEVSNNDYYWALKEHGEWSYHSLGTEWIQVPWPMPGHVHLPYSIEEYCLKLPVKPHTERDSSVLIFAKRSSYFHLSQVSPIHFWSDLAREPNFTLLSTAEVEEGEPMPDGLETMGRQTRDAYEEVVGASKVLLGMGFPPISPSVYTALCQGTPVVLPYRVSEFKLQKGGWDIYSGHYQHGPAMVLGAPYVYSYQKDNYTQLVEMVNKALTTPIERYIPDDMKLPYALAQTKAFLNRDLYAMFRKVLHKNGGEVPRLQAGALERCHELKRCKPNLDIGRRPNTPAWCREEEAKTVVLVEQVTEA